MSATPSLSLEEKSWILYDAANSAFVLVMVTAIMPIYFKDVAARGVADAISTSNWRRARLGQPDWRRVCPRGAARNCSN